MSSRRTEWRRSLARSHQCLEDHPFVNWDTRQERIEEPEEFTALDAVAFP